MINFSDFYGKLRKCDKQLFRKAAFQRLGWGHSTFYYKQRHGNLTIPEKTLLHQMLEEFSEKLKDESAMNAE